MFWHFLKHYMSVVVAVFFKRTRVKNVDNLKINAPAILAMNHPNSFADPIALSSIIYPPRTWYLARGDAFKKGIVTTLLQGMGIIPIFRIQDGGKEGLAKNDETYDIVNKLLRKKKKIIVFAEGLSIQERRLRPLKKGVPRMAFGAVDEFPELANLVIIPIGVNYSWPVNFRCNVFYNVGEPIKLADYLEQYKEAPAKAMNRLMADLAVKMKELIVTINHERNEKIVEHIEEIYRSIYFKKHKLNSRNLEHDFMFSTSVAQTINNADASSTSASNNDERLEGLKEKAQYYFSLLQKYKLRDWLLNPSKKYQVNYVVLALSVLLIIATIPFYVIGFIGNYWIYKVTDTLVKQKVKLPEFKSSFMIGIGAVLCLINYSVIYTVPSLLYNYWAGILAVFVFAICGQICIWLSPLRKKTLGIWRLLQLKKQNPKTYNELQKQRSDIILLYEKL